MQAVHYELIRLMHMRMNYVHIIASLKFILKKPIYSPSVEKEQLNCLIEVASELSLDPLFIRKFMRVLCKISRETQRNMHELWSLERGNCVQFLLSQLSHIPMLQLSFFSSKLNELDEYAKLFFDQFIHSLRHFIRIVDMQIVNLLSFLTDNFSLSFVKDHFSSWYQFSNEILLYKLFLLIKSCVKKEDICC